MIEQGKDRNAELAVIACLAQQPTLYWRVVDTLTAKHFYFDKLHQAYEVFQKLVATNETVPDYVAWMQNLQLRGIITEEQDVLQAALNEWPAFADLPSAIEVHARSVMKASRWRTLYKLKQKMEDVFEGDPDLDTTLGDIRGLFAAASAGEEAGRTRLLSSVAEETPMQTSYQAIATGFADLDHLIGGLVDGWLVVIAARPSMGKTALAMSLAKSAALAGKRVLMFPIEMSSEQIFRRFVTMETGISFNQQMGAVEMSPLDRQRFEEARDRIADTYGKNLILNDSPWVTPDTIKAEVARAMDTGGVDLVIVDFIQNMSTATRYSTIDRVSHFSSSLKLLAREMVVPVVALSQLSRESERRADHRPILSDLRDSGTIEQDADVVAFLYRDEYYDDDTLRPGIAEVLVRKNRFGPVGTAELFFRRARSAFYNLNRAAPLDL